MALALSLKQALAACAGLACLAGPLHGQTPSKLWGETGLPASTGRGSQYLQDSISDGNGGVIATWDDVSDPWSGNLTSLVYVQRLDASGTPRWNLNGLPLTFDTPDPSSPVLTTDGAGGAIVAWMRHQPSHIAQDVYAQRVAADGSVLWQEQGLLVRTGIASKRAVRITADGAGGAILTWEDGTAIRAQRLRADGSPAWSIDGIAVVENETTTLWPAIASDGAGGAIISWQSEGGLFAQHVDAGGVRLWPPDGVSVALRLAGQNVGMHQIMADGGGGAILAWMDGRNSNTDIFAQRLDSRGVAQWTPGGLAICTHDHNQDYPVLAPDGAGGAILAWEDTGGGFADFGQWILAQRVDAGGTVRWPTNGVMVSDVGGYTPRLAPDGSGGVFVLWDGNVSGERVSAYAQRLDDAGQRRWGNSGLKYYGLQTVNAGFGARPVSDDAGGVIALWTDYRFTAESTTDIFGQRLSDRVAPPPSMAADLSLALSASPDPVTQGGNLTYVATVTNAGPGPATLVAFNSEVPSGSRFYLATPSQGECAMDGLLILNVSCRLGTIAAGATVEVRYVVRSHGYGLGTLTNIAFVAGNEKDPNEANNQATVVTEVFFDPRPPSTSFFTLTPCRVLDTRSGAAIRSGVDGALALAGRCGIPLTAIAVSINITVTEPTGFGHLTVYPDDVPRPTSSSINYSAGQTRANSAVVRLSDGPRNRGLLAFYAGPRNSGNIHLVIDVNGYFE